MMTSENVRGYQLLFELNTERSIKRINSASAAIMATNITSFIVLSFLVTFGNTQGSWSPGTGGTHQWQNQPGIFNNNLSPSRPFATVPPPPGAFRPTVNHPNNYPQNRPSISTENLNNYTQNNRPSTSTGNFNNFPQNQPSTFNGNFHHPSATRPFGTIPPPRQYGHPQYPSNDYRYGTSTPSPYNWAGSWDHAINSRPFDGFHHNASRLYPSLNGIRN